MCDATKLSPEDVAQVICCHKSIEHFEARAYDSDVPAPAVVDLRAVSGWSGQHPAPLAKLAALLNDAATPAAPAKTLDVISEGRCLVVGDQAVATEAARQLAPYLSVTLLLKGSDNQPDIDGVEVIVGKLRSATGALGQFDVTLDALQLPHPGSSEVPTLSEPRDGGRSTCDVILDLRGDTPLFPAHEKREGYLRADPAHPAAVSAAVLAASHLTGTFEKPLYVQTEALLCAHSRAGQTGCSRCLDLCPTGAISPNGDHVSIDPMVCAGCGACAAACPSEAIRYDAPPTSVTIRRVQSLAQTIIANGVEAPKLLIHDGHGAEMIRLVRRHYDGLDADVIPLHVTAVGTFGHAEILAAAAAGFVEIAILPGPLADRDAIASQVALATALAGKTRILIADIADPETLADVFEAGTMPPQHQSVRPLGSRRQIARTAAKALNPEQDIVALPTGAPYGAIAVDTDSCTLCLSCVSLCPSGALGDNSDKPQLRFQEDACLQCGICATICPEKAISLTPQFDLTDAALEQRILNEEEPFACISCNTLFGSKKTIDRITEKLAGHSMFAGSDRLAMIQMCDDCRVAHQMHSEDQPLSGGERPRPRTTDDYLSARRDH
ncbi:4Fe-4S binding protein [Yoonia litorea]|nr:4Fe-4S binding protein [Yoonia litorea]